MLMLAAALSLTFAMYAPAYVSPPSTAQQNYAGCLHHNGPCIKASLPTISDEGLGGAGTTE